jgi:hypothetical protein
MRGNDQSGYSVGQEKKQSATQNGGWKQKTMIAADEPSDHMGDNESHKTNDAQKGDDDRSEQGGHKHPYHPNPFNSDPQTFGRLVPSVNCVVAPGLDHKKQG